MRQRPPTVQPARCTCQHAVSIPEWHGQRGNSGTTLHTGRAAVHDGSCVHDEMHRTTQRGRLKITTRRMGIV